MIKKTLRMSIKTKHAFTPIKKHGKWLNIDAASIVLETHAGHHTGPILPQSGIIRNDS